MKYNLELVKTRSHEKLSMTLKRLNLEATNHDFRDSIFAALNFWKCYSTDYGLCCLAIIQDFEDQAFNALNTSEYLIPIPLALVEEQFEVRFGYIVATHHDIELQRNELVLKSFYVEKRS